MSVLICIDGKCVADCNDPSDAWDWLILEHGLPKELFLKEAPDHGPSWDDLPLKFWWNCHRYMVSKVDNLRRQVESECPVLEKSPGARKEAGKFFPFAGNDDDNGHLGLM